MSYVNNTSSILLGALLPVIAIGVSAIRLGFARGRNGSSGVQDWFLLAALLLTSGSGALMITGGTKNALRGTASTSSIDASRDDELLSKLAFAFLPLTTLALGAVRIATLTSYKKAFPGHVFQRINKVLIWLVSVVAVVFAVAYLASCGNDVASFFASNDIRQRKCSATFSFLAAFGLTDIILDAITVILPIYPSWHLAFSRKQISLSVAVVILGVFGVVAGSLRTAFSFQIATSTTSDPLSILSAIIWWFFVEVGVSLIIACILPLLNPSRTAAESSPRRLDIEALRSSPSRGPLETWGTDDSVSISSQKEPKPRLSITRWRSEKRSSERRNQRREHNKSKESRVFKKNVHFSPIITNDEHPGRYSPPVYATARSGPLRPAPPLRMATDSSLYSAGSSVSLSRPPPPTRSASDIPARDKPRQTLQAYLHQKRLRSTTLPVAEKATEGKRLGAEYSPPNMSGAFQGRLAPPPVSSAADTSPSGDAAVPAKGALQVVSARDRFLKAETQNMELVKGQIRDAYASPRIKFSPLVVPSKSELENWPLPKGLSPLKSPGLSPGAAALTPLSPGILARLEELPTPTSPEYDTAETAKAVPIQRVQCTPPRTFPEPTLDSGVHPMIKEKSARASTAPTLQASHQTAPSAETVQFFYDPARDSPICTSSTAMNPLYDTTPSLMPMSTRSSDTLPAHLLLKIAAEKPPPLPSLDGLTTPLSPWPQTLAESAPTTPSKHRPTQSAGMITPTSYNTIANFLSSAQGQSLLHRQPQHRATRSLDDLWALPPLALEEAAALIPTDFGEASQSPPHSPPLHQTPYSATSSIFNFFRHVRDKSTDSTVRPLFCLNPHTRTRSDPDLKSPRLVPSITKPSSGRQSRGPSPTDSHKSTTSVRDFAKRRFSSPTSPPTPLPEEFPAPPAPRHLSSRIRNIPIVNIQSPSPPRPPSGDFPKASPPANLTIAAVHGRGLSECSMVTTPGFFCRGLEAEIVDETADDQHYSNFDDYAAGNALDSATAHILDGETDLVTANVSADAEDNVTPELEQSGFTPPTSHTRAASSESIATPPAAIPSRFNLPARFKFHPDRQRISAIPFTFPDPMMAAIQNEEQAHEQKERIVSGMASTTSFPSIPGFNQYGKSDEQIFDEVRATRREQEKVLRLRAQTTSPDEEPFGPALSQETVPKMKKKEKELTFAEALADTRVLAAAADRERGLLNVDGQPMRISVLDPVSPLDVDFAGEGWGRLRARVGMGRWSALGINLEGA